MMRTVLILAPLPLGAWAAWLLGRAFASRWAPVAATIAYSSTALPYNALANGELRALWVYAMAPLVAAGFARMVAEGDEAEDLDATADARRPFLSRVAPLGLLAGALALVHPAAIGVVVLLAVAFVVGGVLAAQPRGSMRILAAAAGAVMVGLVLHFPVLIDLMTGARDPFLLLGWQRGGESVSEVGDVIRFSTGPLGHSPLGWALLPAAALALIIGRGWRFGWAVRGWVLAYCSFALALGAGRGWFELALPTEELLLVPAAIGLAIAAAMGVAAFELDLRGYGFGWRQAASVVAGLFLVASALPVLGGSFGGRWRVPDGDLNRSLSFVTDEAAASGGFRILWLGRPDVLPVLGWPLGDDDELMYGTSDGLPTIADIAPAPAGDATPLLGDSVQLALAGETSRLGHLLAPMGVRYLVIPDGLAPEPFGGELAPVDPSVADAFTEQLDLVEVGLNRELRVFRNTAWIPVRASIPIDREAAGDAETALAQTVAADLTGSRLVLEQRHGPFRATGEIEGIGPIHVASGSDPGWELTIAGRSQPRRRHFGWAVGFEAEQSGAGELTYRTPSSIRLALFGQLALWIVLIVFVWRGRVRRFDDVDDVDDGGER